MATHCTAGGSGEGFSFASCGFARDTGGCAGASAEAGT